jgi:simple sugar transport system permease protein
MKKLFLNIGVQKIISALLSIFFGLVFGIVILLIASFFVTKAAYPLDALFTIITGGLRYSGLKGLGVILRFLAPILMTGLSVGFAFKTGLFNIGASGQFVTGAFVAAYICIKWTFIPLEYLWIIGLVAAIIAGGLVGLISGLLKAYRNVNEVISAIMLNYIAMITVSNLVKVIADVNNPSRTQPPLSHIPTFGLDKIFGNNSTDISIFIAILVAILVYVILERTTFGYELKACGFNRNAARYAGINDRLNISLSMGIAGALAGLGGAMVYISAVTKVFDQLLVLAPEGFDGISVALLGMSNPIGIIFSAAFIAALKNAGPALSRSGFNEEVVKIMTAVIIYASAFSLIFQEQIVKFFSKKGAKK